MEFKYPKRKALQIEDDTAVDLDPKEYENVSSEDLNKIIKTLGTP